MCVPFFLYIYIHICAYILFAALLCGILVRKEELHSRCFPESQSKCLIYCGKERGGHKKASSPRYAHHTHLSGWAARLTAESCDRLLGPTRQQHRNLLAQKTSFAELLPTELLFYPCQKKREREKKKKTNPKHNTSFCESLCLKSSEEAYNRLET